MILSGSTPTNGMMLPQFAINQKSLPEVSERMTATKPEAVAEADLPSSRPETVAAADLPSSAESPRTSKTPAYFTTKIALTAEAIARYGVSDEAAAFILSSYNKDRDVVTRKKIRCQRESGRSDHVKKFSGTSAVGIYFDGGVYLGFAVHFYNQIRRQAQYFSGDLLMVLQKNLQTNSSSAHPDNILVGMVACDDPVRREGSVMMILKIRDLPTIGGIRENILPKLFFKSSSFKSMIKFHLYTRYPIVARRAWPAFRPSASRDQRYLAYKSSTYTAWNGKKLPVTEPPLLMKKTRDELLSYVDTPFSSDYPSQ